MATDLVKRKSDLTTDKMLLFPEVMLASYQV